MKVKDIYFKNCLDFIRLYYYYIFLFLLLLSFFFLIYIFYIKYMTDRNETLEINADVVRGKRKTPANLTAPLGIEKKNDGL